MKYIGIAAMAAACAAGGFFAAARWRERLAVLLQLRRMMFYLKGEILYSNAPLAEAMSHVGERVRFLGGERTKPAGEPEQLFLRVGERLAREAGRPFFLVWKEEVEALPADFPLAREDRQALATLGESLGYADRQTQERTLLLYLEQLDDSIAFLKREMESRTKLYRSLGAAAGLFLIIIMM